MFSFGQLQIQASYPPNGDLLLNLRQIRFISVLFPLLKL